MDTCNADPTQLSSACAYVICRRGILTYFVNAIGPISYSVLAFTLFQVVIMVLNGMLICYTKRDSIEVILDKSGTTRRGNRNQQPQRPPPTSASAPLQTAPNNNSQRQITQGASRAITPPMPTETAPIAAPGSAFGAARPQRDRSERSRTQGRDRGRNNVTYERAPVSEPRSNNV